MLNLGRFSRERMFAFFPYLSASALALCMVWITPAAASVTVGGLSYSLQAVHVASSIGPEGFQQNANGEYIVIRLRVTNVGHSAASISSSDFHLRRGSETYDASSASMMADQGFFLDTINPGTARTGTILFDVPASTSPSKYQLEVYGNGGSDPTYIGL
jgi:hypothetical protein